MNSERGKTMRLVEETQKYWNYEEWQKTFANYYQPLIDQQQITDFTVSIEDYDANCIEVVINYTDMRALGGELPCRGPEQLPPHIKLDYIITVGAPTINDLLEVINHYEEYWPGVEMSNLSITQNKNEEAVSVLVLSNYEAEEEEINEQILES